MNRYKKTFYYLSLVISALSIPYFVLALIDNAVSLKYETNDPADCISLVTGNDLCFRQYLLEGLILISLLILLLLVAFRKRFLSRSKNIQFKS